MSNKVDFKKRISIEQVEEGTELAPKFDDNGLIPAVTTSAKTGEVLMLGYMNQEALTKTIQTGEAYYYSRSRNIIWHKGANSGFVQKVKDLRIDDDQDAVWLSVELIGKEASCHVGYRSCFYRSIPTKDERAKSDALIFREDEKTFDPKEVYGDVPNPTKL
jgi:phosphoribosyl-AMP cyclohydrolase